MGPFRTPVDIANKALSVLRQPAIYSFQDNTVQSIECARVYDVLRLAELRRALWRFSTRRVILRPIDNTTMYLVPPAWDGTTNFNAGDIASYGNQVWVALIPNTGQTPSVVPAGGTLLWDSYFGPLTVDVWNGPIVLPASPTGGTTNPTTYFTGELVFKTPGDGSYAIYRSRIQNNADNPQMVDQWTDDQVYQAAQVVSFNSINYQSLINLNFNNEPDVSPSQWTTTITSPLVSNSWTPMATSALTPLNIVWPLGTGPASNLMTRNVFRLPAGFLRRCPTDPRAGINPILGGPVANLADDFLFEGDWIVSQTRDAIMVRFIADMQNVPSFDALFAVAM